VSHRLRTREWSGVDYYAELGITSEATRAEIDEAYRRQAKALHPDRNPEATAEDRFKRLTAAYEVLRDPVTREAYDDFRFRVAAGLLYAATPPRAPRVPTSTPPVVTYRRPRKARKPLPTGVRLGIGYALIVLGVAAALWALVGPLPSHTAGDTDLAVQITIGIMAAKLLACGVVVIKYPELKARWHREPGVPVSPAGRGDRAALENRRNIT
jgi:hypothetical protein